MGNYSKISLSPKQSVYFFKEVSGKITLKKYTDELEETLHTPIYSPTLIEEMDAIEEFSEYLFFDVASSFNPSFEEGESINKRDPDASPYTFPEKKYLIEADYNFIYPDSGTFLINKYIIPAFKAEGIYSSTYKSLEEIETEKSSEGYFKHSEGSGWILWVKYVWDTKNIFFYHDGDTSWTCPENINLYCLPYLGGHIYGCGSLAIMPGFEKVLARIYADDDPHPQDWEIHSHYYRIWSPAQYDGYFGNYSGWDDAFIKFDADKFARRRNTYPDCEAEYIFDTPYTRGRKWLDPIVDGIEIKKVVSSGIPKYYYYYFPSVRFCSASLTLLSPEVEVLGGITRPPMMYLPFLLSKATGENPGFSLYLPLHGSL